MLYIYCTYFYITGVEKNNDDVRTYHLTKSNKWDAPRDILLASKRLQVTGEQARKRRGYQKANNEYWSTQINEKRAKRRKQLAEANPVCGDSAFGPDHLDITNLSVAEIKAKLQELGVKTRARKLEKLQDILRAALKD